MSPFVSIIIPTYNGAKYISDALKMALAQTYDFFEVIVIDDGSTDNTYEIVKKYINSPTHEFNNSLSKIKYIYKKNGGPANARNLGINSANGKVIAFLDADDVWLPDKLEKQVDLLRKDKNIGLVHTGYFNFEDNYEVRIAETRPKDNGVVCGYVFAKLFWHNFIATSSVIVKKECFNEVGMFDEELRRGQDYDMWLRISKEYKVGYINEALVGYRINNEEISSKIDNSYLCEKKIIEKLIGSYSNIEALTGIKMKHRFAKLYLDYGLDLLEQERLKEAREKFLNSFRYYPLDLKSLRNYFKCLLPIKLFKTLKVVKRSLQNEI